MKAILAIFSSRNNVFSNDLGFADRHLQTDQDQILDARALISFLKTPLSVFCDLIDGRIVLL
jgi:hypothetical protein